MKKTARKKKNTFFEKTTEPVIEAIVPEVKDQKKVRKLLSNKPFLIGATIVIIIAVAASIYTFLFFQKDAPLRTQEAQLSSEQVELLVKEVGEKVVLPPGETPTIATVTDVEKLAGQPFFRNAQNGDKVIIYGSTKEAILYRPSLRKIITMSPINNTDLAPAQPSNAPEVAVSGTPTLTPVLTSVQKIKVAVLNSTKEAGLARKGANLLDKEKYEIISTSNAQGEYAATTVSQINKTTTKDSDIRSIISTLSNVKATNKALPSDEAAPAGADVIVILGEDFAEAY